MNNFIIIIFLITLSFHIGAEQSCINNNSLEKKIEALYKEDQKIRNEIIKNGIEKISEEQLIQSRNLTELHRKEIEKIFEDHGFPGNCLVSTQSVLYFFTLIQHSDIEIKKRYFPEIENAWNEGNIPNQSYAIFLDKMKISEGQKQIYGTQVKFINNQIELLPVIDIDNLDKRRLSIGLGTFDEYKELLNKVYRVKNNPQ